MQFLGYLAFLIFLYPISFLPSKLIYAFSDFVAFLLYKVFKYWSDIISKNLKECFPEKSETELEQIKKESYQNLADIMIESIHYFNLNEKKYISNYKLINKSVIEDLYEKKQTAIVVLPHLGNWEGATGISGQIDNLMIGLYKPIKNIYLERAFKNRRERLGTIMESIKGTALAFEKHKDKTCLIVMISDQSPSNASRAYITNFLNRKTAFLKGPAKYALKYKYPIIQLSMVRDKNARGKYDCTLNNLIEKPWEMSEDEILEKIANCYEAQIKANPGQWLWSHNRWKKDLTGL